MNFIKVMKRGGRYLVIAALISFGVLVAWSVVDVFRFAHIRAQRVQCVEGLKQIHLTALIWAHDESNFMPRTFLDLSNRLASPQDLVCPVDAASRKAMRGITDWKGFDERLCSYEIVHPGISVSNKHNLFVRCKAHDQFAAGDGTVHSRFDLTNGTFGFQYERPLEPTPPYPAKR